MTLTVHLVWRAVRRSRVARVLKMAIAIFLKLLDTTGGSLVLTRNLSARLVADWWELNGSTLLVSRGRTAFRALTITGDGSSSSTVLVLLSLVLFLLLACFPLLSDFLELFRSALVPVRLHSNVGIEMV